ncbi:uncharacterized [Tachysurus ichikawai]
MSGQRPTSPIDPPGKASPPPYSTPEVPESCPIVRCLDRWSNQIVSVQVMPYPPPTLLVVSSGLSLSFKVLNPCLCS